MAHLCVTYTVEQIYESALATFYDTADNDPELFAEDYLDSEQMSNEEFGERVDGFIVGMDILFDYMGKSLNDDKVRTFLRTVWDGALVFNDTLGGFVMNYERQCGMVVCYHVAKGVANNDGNAPWDFVEMAARVPGLATQQGGADLH